MKSNLRDVISTIAFVLISIFVAGRYQLGIDWLFYSDFYEDPNSTSLLIEPGYLMLSKFFSYFNVPFVVFYTMISIFGVVVIYKFFNKLSPYPVLCLLLYFLTSLAFTFEALRQNIALSIILLAVLFYIKKRTSYYFIAVLIASFFHVSALLMLVVPVVVKSRYLVKYAIPLLFIGMLLVVLDISLIRWVFEFLHSIFNNGYSAKVLHYLSETEGVNALTFSLVIKVGLFIVVYYHKDKISTAMSHRLSLQEFDKLLGFLTLFLLMSVFLADTGTLMSRIANYFIPIYSLFLSYLVFIYVRNFDRTVIGFLIVAIFSLSFYRFTLNSYFIEQYLPYRNVLTSSSLPSNIDDRKRVDSIDLHWSSK
ncbi:EpsG family protein [Vibrio sp. 10N.261.49.A12]|uniref:EpsG family protein n=1 Tax=Vibrio sp. 10N.261.49.A12 TaxID=3229667 RepID=UPI0035511FDD